MTDTAITPTERRHLNLTQGERSDLAEQRQIELAVSYFLDLEQDRTVKQIAEEMGLSVSALKRLTAKPEFQNVYDEALMGLGHHPRLQALTSNLPELLPFAYQALKRLLVNPRTSATAQVQAIKLLFDTVGIGKQTHEEDPAALHNFMMAAGINVGGNAVVNVNLPIPTEYQAAFARLMGGKSGATVAHSPDNVIDVPSEDVFPTPETPSSELPAEEVPG